MLNADAMDAVWAESDEVSCIHPGAGPIRGRQRVIQSWSEVFEGIQEVVFQLDQVEVHVVGTTGWVTLVEQIEQRQNGQLVRGAALATNVFAHGLSGWRMVHHHASSIARVRPSGPRKVDPSNVN